MRRSMVAVALLLCSAALAGGEEIRLFNGKDLSGWKGDQRLWRVEEGAIVGKTDGLTYNTFLITDKKYENFELSFEVNLRNHNSGVQFRSKIVDPKKYVLSGYQADTAEGYWGLLYEEKARGKLDFRKDVTGLAKLGEWAKYVVRADGPDITIKVNGVETVHYVEKDPQKGAKTGYIGLQLHGGPPMEVRFKNIVLRTLD